MAAAAFLASLITFAGDDHCSVLRVPAFVAERCLLTLTKNINVVDPAEYNQKFFAAGYFLNLGWREVLTQCRYDGALRRQISSRQLTIKGMG